jgi:2,4-dienoyl-CoA reductase-like NADH-dependent reductase (Old Yellow Enzyme family)
MTDGEIADVIAGFARSAANAKKIGFDGIALHGAHGYLFDTFFWDETNRRRDRYGGGLVERCRFAGDVVRAIRGEVGSDLPIMFRFSQWKQQDFDAKIAKNPKELEEWLGCLVDAGVDMFDASTRMFDTPEFEGSHLTLAAWTRQITGKITMAVGGVGTGRDFFTRVSGTPGFVANNIERVARAMVEGQFDLIGVGRALIADPQFVHKIRDGAELIPYTQEARDVLY